MMADQTNALIIRSKTNIEKDYHKYQDLLRFDFCYSCAYCSITEIEATGIGFQIDHYLPREHFPQLDTDYINLMWACQRCNRCKSDYFPDDDDKKNGFVVLKIDECDPRDHLESEDVFLKDKTKTGEFNIELLDLNRKQLRRVREYRKRLSDATNYIAFGIQDLMAIDLDKIHPQYRLLFQRIKQRIADRNKEVTRPMQEIIREFGRSELLDKDPEQKERQRKRKEYLKEAKAILPQ